MAVNHLSAAITFCAIYCKTLPLFYECDVPFRIWYERMTICNVAEKRPWYCVTAGTMVCRSAYLTKFLLPATVISQPAS